MRKILIRSWGLLVLLATTGAQAAPVDTAKSFIEELVTISEHSKQSAGKSSDESQVQIKAASAKVDFTALARKSFGPARWKSFKENEKQDFLKTFQDLLETVAYPKAKKISTQKESLQYKALPGKANQVQVGGEIEREKKGELVKQKLEIVLHVDAKSNKITDAVIDNELLSSNLKRQFDNALKKKSFAQIITQMRKRVDEAKNPGSTKSDSPKGTT